MEENNETIKCPQCGGELSFNKESVSWTCGSCGGQFSDRDILDIYARKRSVDDTFRVFQCMKCGHELLCTYDADQTPCPYCGELLGKRGELITPPEFRKVFPINVSKTQAAQILKKELGKQWFVPKLFNNDSISKMKLIFVPMYQVSGTAKLHGRAQRIRIDDMPICPCPTSITEEMMQMIEPIYWSSAEDFRPERIGIYPVERSTATQKSLKELARQRIWLGLGKHETNELELECNGMYLLPVWMYTTSHKGKDYRMALDASSGRFLYTQNPGPNDEKNFVIKWSIILILIAELILFIFLMIR
ncbi:MAG: hypothetical protein MJZ66_05035 [Bacteroidales bacterium]|nr:hypothetical protein [Bacteroidales bacterium]